MADEILRSKHGFGNLVDVSTALEAGKIDAYDILFLDGSTEPKIGWIDKDNNLRLVKNESVVVVEGNSLPASGVQGKVYIFNDEGYFWNGTEFVNFCKPTDVTELSGRLTTLESNFKTLESDLEKLDTTIVDLKAEVEKLKSDVSGLQTNVKDLQTGISSLQTEIEKKANVEEVNAELASKANAEEVESKLATKADTAEVNEKLEKVATESVATAKNYTDGKVEAAVKEHLVKKFEISGTPDGTLVNINEREIRIMCPVNSEFTKQSVGSGGDPNCYYATLKTYVFDDNVVGYREHLGSQSDSETLTDLKTDEYGRKYQLTWLALAKYDDATGTWNYYGKNSSINKYIGWDYEIDWYDAYNKIVASDSIRISLSNEECHFVNEPYYVGKIMKEVDTKIEEKIAEVEAAYEVIEF